MEEKPNSYDQEAIPKKRRYAWTCMRPPHLVAGRVSEWEGNLKRWVLLLSKGTRRGWLSSGIGTTREAQGGESKHLL